MITVCPKRDQCEKINKIQLHSLPDPPTTFEAEDDIPVTPEMMKVLDKKRSPSIQTSPQSGCKGDPLEKCST